MSGRSEPVLLKLVGVTREFGDGGSGPALAGVDLEVSAGEFVAIVGASGAGKSTLLNVLGLLDSPTTGEYWLDGIDTTGLNEAERDIARARSLGFVFQDGHMLARETVGQNAALGLSVNRVDPALRPGIVARALDTVGMLAKAQSLAASLSGGERQRVAIARAIAAGPKIILADEPTGALDAANSANVIATLRRLNEHGTTVILVTHDTRIAQRADRILTMSDGGLVGDETISLNAGSSGEALSMADPPGTGDPPEATENGRVVPVGTQSRFSRACERLAAAVSKHSVHLVRASLLLTAFSIGAGGLIAALGFSESATAQVTDRLDASGLDAFIVTTRALPEAIRSEFDLAREDSMLDVAEAARRRMLTLAGVTDVGILIDHPTDVDLARLDPAAVQRQPRPRSTLYIADETYLKLQGIRVGQHEKGAELFLGSADFPAVLLGAELADQLDLRDPRSGDHVWIDGTAIAVSGVIDDAGNEPRCGSAIVGNPALAGIVETSAPTLLVGTEPGAPARLAPATGRTISPGDPGLFEPEVVADMSGLKEGIASDMIALVGALSWVLLALSALSAGVTVHLSVHARATEIALRRAVGESRRSVAFQFVLEGLTIGFLGGVIGSGLGIVLLVVSTRVLGWAPIFSPQLVAIGVVAGAATGVLASVCPAVIAAGQEPAHAVRGV